MIDNNRTFRIFTHIIMISLCIFLCVSIFSIDLIVHYFGNNTD